MNISARTQYACLAVMQLAANYDTGEPVRVRSIAQAHAIPSDFLVQILRQLKGAGLVASTRGAAGGYHLLKDPTNLTLGEVMRIIDGNDHSLARNCNRETPQARALQAVWNRVAKLQRQILDGTSFQDLLDRAESTADPMYYI